MATQDIDIQDAGYLQRFKDYFAEQVQYKIDRDRMILKAQEESAPSAGQMANFGGMLLPTTGIAEAIGKYPSMGAKDQPFSEAFSNEPYPSMAENLKRGGFGGYFDAAMQGLGVLGDVSYATPIIGGVVGPTVGTALKATGAAGKVIKRGITSLDFDISDLKKLFVNNHPSSGSIDPNTGNQVTERLIQSRADKLEKNLKKPAVRRREEARAANQIEDLIPQERNILDPNDLYGHSLVPVAGDRSGIGTITDVNGVPLSFPVKVQGGPGYPQFMGEGKGWASMQGAAHQKQMNFIRAEGETGMPALGVYTAMGREGINFSTPVALAMVGQLDFLKIPQKHISSFNASLRRGTPSNPGIKDFVGLSSPDLVPQLLGNVPGSVSSGNIRKALVEEMKKPKWQNLGFPLYEDVVETITNPQLRISRGPKGTLNPSETGYTIFRADPSKQNYADPYHLSYDTVIPGDYLGGLTGTGAPPELLFPQNFARMQEKLNVAGRPLTRQQQLGSLAMEPMVEPVTDNLIENLAKYLNRTQGTKYAEGGEVTDQNVQRLKQVLKNAGINKLYEAADSLGFRLPSGIGVDSAADVITNELLSRANIPLQKRGDMITLQKQLPKGINLGLDFNPKQSSGFLNFSGSFKADGGEVNSVGIGRLSR
tara:strand:- start:172 stop:2127 length:1956 start_codon:yes stop_codon:yes gene_type:complete